MTDINKLKEEELANLNDNELYNLEDLITGGTDVRVPVTITFPKFDEEKGRVEMVEAAAYIRPLSNVEWNNAARLKRSPNSTTTNEVEILKKALYKVDGEQMPPKLVEAIPNGVVIELVKEVSRISGVDVEANMKMVKDMMGFSL